MADGSFSPFSWSALCKNSHLGFSFNRGALYPFILSLRGTWNSQGVRFSPDGLGIELKLVWVQSAAGKFLIECTCVCYAAAHLTLPSGCRETFTNHRDPSLVFAQANSNHNTTHPFRSWQPCQRKRPARSFHVFWGGLDDLQRIAVMVFSSGQSPVDFPTRAALTFLNAEISMRPSFNMLSVCYIEVRLELLLR